MRAVKSALWILAALFAIVWAAVRAKVQSITMDEAQTYLFCVAHPNNLFYPFSNNHVLNSLLMWISTTAFGVSSLTLRAPALLGGVLYIGTCLFLSRHITDRFSLQFPIFICLVYNPFVFDFMIAARGYGLADAFLMASIAVPVWHAVKGTSSLRASCAVASLALGLSFTANFAFAMVDIAALLAILIWAIAAARERRESESIPRVVGFCTLPGLLVALPLCGYPLMHWKREELWWGAHSFGEMGHTLMEYSLYQLEPQIFGILLYQAMDFLKPFLLPALGLFTLARLLAAWRDGSWGKEWQGRFALALAAIVAVPVIVQGLAFHFARIPLPLGRTGIYLVPLSTLLAGTIAAAPARSGISQWLRRGTTTVFICLGCYCLLCLRMSYFVEYKWDADLKEVYSVLAGLNHTYGVTDIEIANGLYSTSLNYYRTLSQQETFGEFPGTVAPPRLGKSIYVLNGVSEQWFIDQEKLEPIYRGSYSDVVIAVNPERWKNGPPAR